MEKNVRCFVSDTFDPYFNLATENWIFNDIDPSHHVLFLWRNRNSVIIGRNQNPWAECNLAKIQSDNVHLVRRESGGGAVFQDLGNMNFTFLSSRRAYDRNQNYSVIIRALQRFGIQAEQHGRNDIVVNGAKVSGSAFKEKIDRAFHHGTLMIDVDLSRLSQYLTPSKKKLLAKGVTSVRSRVANLREFCPSITQESLSEAIIEEFFHTHEMPRHVETLSSESLKDIPALKTYYEMLKSSEWTFGETPQFQHHLEERLSWGTVNLHFNVHNGSISSVRIYSDALNTMLVDALTKQLRGVPYSKEAIRERVLISCREITDCQEHVEEFLAWLEREID